MPQSKNIDNSQKKKTEYSDDTQKIKWLEELIINSDKLNQSLHEEIQNEKSTDVDNQSTESDEQPESINNIYEDRLKFIQENKLPEKYSNFQNLKDDVIDVFFFEYMYKKMQNDGSTVQDFLTKYLKIMRKIDIQDNIETVRDFVNSFLKMTGKRKFEDDVEGVLRTRKLYKYFSLNMNRTKLTFKEFVTNKTLMGLLLSFPAMLLILNFNTLLGILLYTPLAVSSLASDRGFVVNSIIKETNAQLSRRFFNDKYAKIDEHISRIDKRLSDFEKTQKLSEFSDSGLSRLLEEFEIDFKNRTFKS